jgi:hypothetical protein
MRAAEAAGREPDEDALRRAVGATVLEGMLAGFRASVADDDDNDARAPDGDAPDAKRARTE